MDNEKFLSLFFSQYIQKMNNEIHCFAHFNGEGHEAVWMLRDLMSFDQILLTCFTRTSSSERTEVVVFLLKKFPDLLVASDVMILDHVRAQSAFCKHSDVERLINEAYVFLRLKAAPGDYRNSLEENLKQFKDRWRVDDKIYSSQAKEYISKKITQDLETLAETRSLATQTSTTNVRCIHKWTILKKPCTE